jgi:hypothetical protein
MSVSLTIAVGAPEQITTGAVAVDADPTVQIYEVTTGGTGGVEELNLPYFEDGAAAANVGRRICISLATLTDPADAVKITVDGGSTIDLYPSKYFQNAKEQRLIGGVPLSYEGSFAVFVWTGFDWFLDWTLYGDSPTISSMPVIITTANGASPASTQLSAGSSIADGSAGGGIFIAAGSGTVGNANGGSVTISAGSGTGSGPDGDIVLANGVYFGGSIKLTNLPTADPSIANALWNDAGTIKISAG